MAFGGAGPLHAARLARELEVGRILVPRNPGILCAMGLLLDRSTRRFRRDQADDALGIGSRSPEIEASSSPASAPEAEAWFAQEGIAPADRRITRTVDMRYAGQNYEIAIPVAAGALTADSLASLEAGYLAAHRRLYGFVAEGEPIQLVTFRIEAAGAVPHARFTPQPDAGPDAEPARIGRREVWLPESGGFTTCPVYDRAGLRAGNRLAGPAIVEQMDATTVVLPGMTATVEPFLNLILDAA